MVIGPLELICGGNIQKFVTLYNRPCILYGIFNDPFSWEFERENCLEKDSGCPVFEVSEWNMDCQKLC